MSGLYRAFIAGVIAASFSVGPAAGDLARNDKQAVHAADLLRKLHSVPVIGDDLQRAERITEKFRSVIAVGRGLSQASKLDVNPLEGLGIGVGTGIVTGGLAASVSGLPTATEAQIIQNSQNVISNALGTQADTAAAFGFHSPLEAKLVDGMVTEAEAMIADAGAAQLRRSLVGGAAGLVGGIAVGYGLQNTTAQGRAALRPMIQAPIVAYQPKVAVTTISISILMFGQ